MKELIVGRFGPLDCGENEGGLRALRAHEHETGHRETQSPWRLPVRLLESHAPDLRLAPKRDTSTVARSHVPEGVGRKHAAVQVELSRESVRDVQ